ncbi:MAG: non-homologous end-joining DNA ligase [Methanomassiliicoccales archaeon]|nr:non-homologous end-joining DNA ligase [Methanomassiliicoccales archaeon]
MLARLGSTDDLKRTDCIFEPKLDGTRALLYKKGKVKLLNRRFRDITSRYPELEFSKAIKAGSCVLDGELVVFDEKGNPSFRLLQGREQAAPRDYKPRSLLHPATYVVFDVLEVDGKELMGLPLLERKARLDEMVTDTPTIRKIFYTRDGLKLWDLVYKRGTEGVMAKLVDSTYDEGKRSPSWLKIKTNVTVDCVIVGYTHEIREISSIALGLYRDGRLIFVGKVGTGFDEAFLHELKPRLDAIRSDEPTAEEGPEGGIIWVRPEMVCEVEFLEFTGNGHMRAPSFRGIREDKDPKECTFDLVP